MHCEFFMNPIEDDSLSQTIPFLQPYENFDKKNEKKSRSTTPISSFNYLLRGRGVPPSTAPYTAAASASGRCCHCRGVKHELFGGVLPLMRSHLPDCGPAHVYSIRYERRKEEKIETTSRERSSCLVEFILERER